MLDASFSKKSFIDLHDKHDKGRYKLKGSDYFNKAVTKLSDDIIASNFSFALKTNLLNGRKVSSPADYQTALALRNLNNVFRKLSHVKQADRNRIVSKIKLICSEGISYSIARLDIKKYYESIEISALRTDCQNVLGSTYIAKKVMGNFLDWCEKDGSGIPAGIALSGALGELHLTNFDRHISSHPDVHFYARFVDDIIIITNVKISKSDLFKIVKKELPPALELNTTPDKMHFAQVHSTGPASKTTTNFDYLGYNFDIGPIRKKADPSKTLDIRNVRLDISRKKTKIRKTRFILSVKRYLKDGISRDLVDRFLLINSGYRFFDSRLGKERLAGMCNTYSLIDHPSSSLQDLQNFYAFNLLSDRAGFKRLLMLGSLPNSAKRNILSLDLQKHVENKKHFSFPEPRLFHLTSCWSHA